MSSTSEERVTAIGKADLKDGTYSAYWNRNEVSIPIGPWDNDYAINTIVIVDKNIYENGGGGNTRCRAVIKDGIATVTSVCLRDYPGYNNDFIFKKDA